MLKKTETEEIIRFFATFLSKTTFQLGRDLGTSWQRLWPWVPGPLNSNSITFSMSISQLIFFKSVLSRKNWRDGGE